MDMSDFDPSLLMGMNWDGDDDDDEDVNDTTSGGGVDGIDDMNGTNVVGRGSGSSTTTNNAARRSSSLANDDDDDNNNGDDQQLLTQQKQQQQTTNDNSWRWDPILFAMDGDDASQDVKLSTADGDVALNADGTNTSISNNTNQYPSSYQLSNSSGHQMHPLAMTSLASCPPYVNVGSLGSSGSGSGNNNAPSSANDSSALNTSSASVAASNGANDGNVTTGTPLSAAAGAANISNSNTSINTNSANNNKPAQMAAQAAAMNLMHTHFQNALNASNNVDAATEGASGGTATAANYGTLQPPTFMDMPSFLPWNTNAAMGVGGAFNNGGANVAFNSLYGFPVASCVVGTGVGGADIASGNAVGAGGNGAQNVPPINTVSSTVVASNKNGFNQGINNVTNAQNNTNPHYGMAINGFHPQVNAQVNPVLPMPSATIVIQSGGSNVSPGNSSGGTATVKSSNTRGGKSGTSQGGSGASGDTANANAAVSTIAPTSQQHQHPHLCQRLQQRQQLLQSKAREATRERNEREQMRAKKITQLIEELRMNMQKEGWKEEMKSKYETLSQ